VELTNLRALEYLGQGQLSKAKAKD